MAGIEDIERTRASEDQGAALRQQIMKDKHGEVLGKELFDYVYGQPNTLEEAAENRQRLIVHLAYMFGGNTASRQFGISALFNAFEAKIDSVKQQASEGVSER